MKKLFFLFITFVALTNAQKPSEPSRVVLFNNKTYTASNNDTSAVIQNVGNSIYFTLYYATDDSAVATSYIQTRPRWGTVTGSWTTVKTDSTLSVALTTGTGTKATSHYVSSTYGVNDYRFINVFRAGTKLKTTAKTYDEVLFIVK